MCKNLHESVVHNVVHTCTCTCIYCIPSRAALPFSLLYFTLAFHVTYIYIYMYSSMQTPNQLLNTSRSMTDVMIELDEKGQVQSNQFEVSDIPTVATSEYCSSESSEDESSESEKCKFMYMCQLYMCTCTVCFVQVFCT